VKRTALILVLAAVLSTAAAQGFRANGGIDFQPARPYLGFTVTVERPSFDLLGVRWGPIGTLKADTDFRVGNAQLLTGVAGAVVLPDSAWAVKVKILANVQVQTGRPFSIGPDIQLAFATTF